MLPFSSIQLELLSVMNFPPSWILDKYENQSAPSHVQCLVDCSQTNKLLLCEFYENIEKSKTCLLILLCDASKDFK